MSDLSQTDLTEIRRVVREEIEVAMRPPILLVPDSMDGPTEDFIQNLAEEAQAVVICGPKELLDQIKGFGPTTVTMMEPNE